VSGTRRVPAPEASRDGEFPPEEPATLDLRRTPVVAAEWPDDERPTQAPPSDAVISVKEETDSASVRAALAFAHDSDGRRLAGAGALDSVPSQAPGSLRPPAAGEVDFFDKPPVYSIQPPVFVSEPPRPRPSLLRSTVSRVLFAMIVGGVAMLAFYEVMTLHH
jgi:hypothetical protein